MANAVDDFDVFCQEVFLNLSFKNIAQRQALFRSKLGQRQSCHVAQFEDNDCITHANLQGRGVKTKCWLKLMGTVAWCGVIDQPGLND